jgi:hypothetical protein
MSDLRQRLTFGARFDSPDGHQYYSSREALLEAKPLRTGLEPRTSRPSAAPLAMQSAPERFLAVRP